MKNKPDAVEELGKKLGRLVRAAKPRAQRLAAEAKPRVEKARDEALKFAREHEGEGKQLATRLVRARFAGPLGLVIDALVPQVAQEQEERLCARCHERNAPAAKFCSNCGAALEPHQ